MPSACTRARSIARRKAWLASCADRHAALPKDPLVSLERLACKTTELKGKLGVFLKRFMAAPVSTCRRHRELFPMPLLAGFKFAPVGMPSRRWSSLRFFVNVLLGCMHFLYGVKITEGLPERCNAAQTQVCTRLVVRAQNLVARLERADLVEVQSLLPPWYQDPSAPCSPECKKLVAAQVDNPRCACTVDPQRYLHEDVRAVVEDPSLLFEGAPDGLNSFADFSAGERVEYVQHVVNHLRCGKVRLDIDVKGGGTVFVVGKSSGRLREVWHGKRVSSAARRPPRPPDLASPSALIYIEVAPGQLLRVSKRDAECCFDQLRLPVKLRKWMARPPVTIRELIESGGISWEEIQHFLEPDCVITSLDTSIFPVGQTWGMGFAWSSFISQNTLMAICKEANLDERKVVSMDSETPSCFAEIFSVATDDVILMSTAGPGKTSEMAARLEAAMLNAGLVQNTSKNVDDATHAQCVGIDVENGTHWVAPPARVFSALLMVLHLLYHCIGSPKQVHHFLGVLQWFDLLCRPKLSIYSAVYAFTREVDDQVLRIVPCRVLGELAVAMMTSVFWAVDLRRPYLLLIACSDASSEFGFGASVASTSVAVARDLGRLACKQGAFLLLDEGFAAASYASRVGHLFSTALQKDDFTHVFSVKKKRDAHINELEGEAFVLLLRWVLRSRARHCSRIVILVDSAVWLGAASKGRSSSSLNHLLRRAAMLELAGDLMVLLVLVPSGENPSDVPARGLRGRKNKLKFCSGKRVMDIVEDRLREQADYYEAVWRAHCSPPSVGKSDAAPRQEDAQAGNDARVLGVEEHRVKQEVCQSSIPSVCSAPQIAQSVRKRAPLQGLPSGPPGADRRLHGGSSCSKMWSPRALDLFSGSGRLASELTKRGWRVETVDYLFGTGFDLRRAEVQERYLERIANGWYCYVALGPPCSSFSSARCPAVRSNDHPFGKPHLSPTDEQKVSEGNQLAIFSYCVLMLCLQFGIAASLEQPAGSWLWKLPQFISLLALAGVSLVLFPFCAFDTPWRKRTKLLLVNAQPLELLSRKCSCKTAHQVLQGRSPSGRSWTSEAQPYPPALCRAWATALDFLAPHW